MLKLDTGNYLFQVDMAEQNLANPDRIRWVNSDHKSVRWLGMPRVSYSWPDIRGILRDCGWPNNLTSVADPA